MRRIISLIFLILLVACTKQYKNEKIEKFFSSKGLIDSEFSLDTIDNEGWDSVHIAKPYENIYAFKVNNIPGNVKRSIESALFTEGYCVLIFTKKNEFMCFARVIRVNADFSSLEKNKYASGQVYKLDGKRKVIFAR